MFAHSTRCNFPVGQRNLAGHMQRRVGFKQHPDAVAAILRYIVIVYIHRAQMRGAILTHTVPNPFGQTDLFAAGINQPPFVYRGQGIF